MVPLPMSSRNDSYTAATALGASPSDTSSRRMRRGLHISARPIAVACCSPPDSVAARWVRRACSIGKIWRTRSTVQAPPRRWPPAMLRFSSTVRPGKSRLPSGTSAIPSPTRLCAGIRVMSTPSKKTVPAEGRCAPAITRSSVVLPAPLAPTRARVSPSSTLSDTPRTAFNSPYCASTARTSSRLT